MLPVLETVDDRKTSTTSQERGCNDDDDRIFATRTTMTRKGKRWAGDEKGYSPKRKKEW